MSSANCRSTVCGLDHDACRASDCLLESNHQGVGTVSDHGEKSLSGTQEDQSARRRLGDSLRVLNSLALNGKMPLSDEIGALPT